MLLATHFLFSKVTVRTTILVIVKINEMIQVRLRK